MYLKGKVQFFMYYEFIRCLEGEVGCRCDSGNKVASQERYLSERNSQGNTGGKTQINRQTNKQTNTRGMTPFSFSRSLSEIQGAALAEKL